MKQNANPPRNSQSLPLLLVAIGLLLMIAAVVIWQVARPSPGLVAAPRSTATNDPNLPFPDIPRVALEDAKIALDNKEAVFVDVRSAESYAESHVPGALNIPLNDLESRAAELNPNDWIITYCT